MTVDGTRRRIILGGAGVLVATVAGMSPGRGRAAINDFAERLQAFTGGAVPERGQVTLDLPEVAENGNTVPMTVTVESPMTPQDHCETVLVLADGNPNAPVATLRFTPASGRAEVNTRIRLAASQTVVAVARMSDGRYFIDERRIVVTVGGCVG
jgi:sulfur-oxidizing protein SoxY